MMRAPYVRLHVTTGERRATAADIVASVGREIASGAPWPVPVLRWQADGRWCG
ncbi:MAG: hypothetical protein H0T89_12205 [Deltaproteobacteria bacterium]|nr:hypothetical protein [Deltaproteobacteria bacterium]